MIPAPVLAQLELEQGAPIGARNAKVQPCRRCRHLVLAGLDEDLCAFTAHADLEPITDELAALLDGRTTYTLETVHTKSGDRVRLQRRDRWMIAGNAPATIVQDHRCGQK